MTPIAESAAKNTADVASDLLPNAGTAKLRVLRLEMNTEEMTLSKPEINYIDNFDFPVFNILTP